MHLQHRIDDDDDVDEVTYADADVSVESRQQPLAESDRRRVGRRGRPAARPGVNLIKLFSFVTDGLIS